MLTGGPVAVTMNGAQIIQMKPVHHQAWVMVSLFLRQKDFVSIITLDNSQKKCKLCQVMQIVILVPDGCHSYICHLKPVISQANSLDIWITTLFLKSSQVFLN